MCSAAYKECLALRQLQHESILMFLKREQLVCLSVLPGGGSAQYPQVCGTACRGPWAGTGLAMDRAVCLWWDAREVGRADGDASLGFCR